jgi:hypothetical protein
MTKKNKEEENTRCFVISPIGEAASTTRKHMDMVFNSIIIPAFEELDFEKPYRSDHDDDPGLITDKMIESIATDKLVIAVLTDLNPNVFYELGIRHSMQRPTIHLCANGTRLPFDNNDQRTIFYDIEDYYNHREASKKINSYVKNILKDDFIVSNPVTRYKDNLKLRESGDPKDRQLLDMQNDIRVLKNFLFKRDNKEYMPTAESKGFSNLILKSLLEKQALENEKNTLFDTLGVEINKTKPSSRDDDKED